MIAAAENSIPLPASGAGQANLAKVAGKRGGKAGAKKRPAAKQAAGCAKAGRVDQESGTKEREEKPKHERKNVYSRAYHKAYKSHKESVPEAEAKKLARAAAQEAV